MPARATLCTLYWDIMYVHIPYGHVVLITRALICLWNTQLTRHSHLNAHRPRGGNSQNTSDLQCQPLPQLWKTTFLTSYSTDEFCLFFEIHVNAIEQYVLFYASKFSLRVYSYYKPFMPIIRYYSFREYSTIYVFTLS